MTKIKYGGLAARGTLLTLLTFAGTQEVSGDGGTLIHLPHLFSVREYARGQALQSTVPCLWALKRGDYRIRGGAGQSIARWGWRELKPYDAGAALGRESEDVSEVTIERNQNAVFSGAHCE